MTSQRKFQPFQLKVTEMNQSFRRPLRKNKSLYRFIRRSSMHPETLLFLAIALVLEVASVFVHDRSCSCGERLQEGLSERIVRGSEAKEHEFPWVVGLFASRFGIPFCGGNLISDKHIITAAHCVTSFEVARYASLGDHRLSYVTDGGEFYRIKAYSPCEVIHPKYVQQTTEIKARNCTSLNVENEIVVYDIAILELEDDPLKPLKFSSSNPFIRPICLPKPNEMVEQGQAIVAGWGKMAHSGQFAIHSDVLRFATLYLVSQDYCSKLFKEKTNESATIGRQHICAVSLIGSDACQGDSGSGLVAQRPPEERLSSLVTRYELIGITSFGYKCGLLGMPGGYARVSEMTYWIFKRMAETSLYRNVTVCKGFFGDWFRKALMEKKKRSRSLS